MENHGSVSQAVHSLQYMPFDCNKGICVLTHTNVAIDEIKRRMGKASSALFTYPNFWYHTKFCRQVPGYSGIHACMVIEMLRLMMMFMNHVLKLY